MKMTDKEKILMFEKYMRDKGTEERNINYNLTVVKLLVREVLVIFNQTLESIDTYSFEEFTDMTRVIDEYLGGREGLPRIMEAMQELTEFLKVNKMIKGGKIAHYKRMFTNIDYYIDKYDMMTGKRDDTKDFIKNITTNRFSRFVIQLIEDINVYDYPTIEIIDKILNDVPIENNENNYQIMLIIEALKSLELLEVKNMQLETTKKGRNLSRLPIEERYAALLYLFLFQLNWDEVIRSCYGGNTVLDYKDIISIIASVFKSSREVEVELKSSNEISEDRVAIELSTSRFRIARAEAMPFGSKIIDICFEGMGLFEIIPVSPIKMVYRASDFGCEILKFIYKNMSFEIKNKVETISYMIKNRNLEMAEKSILEFLATYGGNSVMWDYLGQILLRRRKYEAAYNVLRYGYETSTKRGKVAKALLYHLVLCCRKLKTEDVSSYEEKLQNIERVNM